MGIYRKKRRLLCRSAPRNDSHCERSEAISFSWQHAKK